MHRCHPGRAVSVLLPLALMGCLVPVIPVSGPGPAASGSAAVVVAASPTATAGAYSAAPRGTSRTVTIRGRVYVSGGGSPSGGTVRIVSVTPNNAFDRRVALDGATYEIASVPTSCQYAIIASVPGQPAKVRVETLLSTAPPAIVRHFGGDAREDLPGSNYTVGVAWCSEDAEEVAATRWLAARALMDIPVFVASPLADATPGKSLPTATPGSGIDVVGASPIAVFTARPIAPCVAHAIRLATPAGVEETPGQATPEAGLVGDWRVNIPGVAWSSGPATATRVGFGAALGELRVAADGAYTWGGVAGRLRQVMPFNGAQPGVAYWLLVDGGGRAHYLTPTDPDTITLYLPGTNLFGAAGTRLL